jgi:hypothetical protein
MRIFPIFAICALVGCAAEPPALAPAAAPVTLWYPAAIHRSDAAPPRLDAVAKRHISDKLDEAARELNGLRGDFRD